jgi:sugar lactone lactonase YvrE
MIRIITSRNLVSTYAGTGTAGNLDGSTADAQFDNPQAVALDGQGNLFVSDSHNYSIRKISASGSVSTFAGNGNSGFTDGTGTHARFVYPQGIAMDFQGNIYVADSSCIRKITPAGKVSTLAGTGISGYNDGPGQVAQFNNARGLTLDSIGHVYVADYGNNRIRKITPQGIVSTLAGTGTAGYLDGIGTTAKFNGPGGIAMDSKGNLYVAEAGNNDIRKITVDGTVSNFAGLGPAGYQDGPARSAKFKVPWGLAIDTCDNIFVADSGNNYIRKIN